MNSRKKEFLDALIRAMNARDPVQDWFREVQAVARAAYKTRVCQHAFLTGAVPEIHNMHKYRLQTCLRQDVSAAKKAGVEWRTKNAPAIVGCWFAAFRFETSDGRYTYYKLPLDPRLIDHFIKRVKRSKSFV